MVKLLAAAKKPRWGIFVSEYARIKPEMMSSGHKSEEIFLYLVCWHLVSINNETTLSELTLQWAPAQATAKTGRGVGASF